MSFLLNWTPFFLRFAPVIDWLITESGIVCACIHGTPALITVGHSFFFFIRTCTGICFSPVSSVKSLVA